MARFRGGMAGAGGGGNRLRPKPAGGPGAGAPMATQAVDGPAGRGGASAGGGFRTQVVDTPPAGAGGPTSGSASMGRYGRGAAPDSLRTAIPENLKGATALGGEVGGGGGTRIAPVPGGDPAAAGGRGELWSKLGFGSREEAAAAMQAAEGQGRLRPWLQGRLDAGGASPEVMTKPAAPGDAQTQTLPATADRGDMMFRIPPGSSYPGTEKGGPGFETQLFDPAAAGPDMGAPGFEAQPFAPEPAPGDGMRPLISPGLRQPSFRQPNPEAMRPILQRLMAGRGAGGFTGGGGGGPRPERRPLAF